MKIKNAYSSKIEGVIGDLSLDADKERHTRRKQLTSSAKKASLNRLDREFITMIIQSAQDGAEAGTLTGSINQMGSKGNSTRLVT